MYIKQIIIQGFKSYKEQTVIEPFSPKTNVIVGRNGSGKSNFFAAIRFVLSDAYTQMGREERQALLHEGSGSAVMSAYVEIIFDNTDERFPTGKPEVILRRTIGMKKDEYSLDRKSATKADVMNLLESAGFSRSNPYYIVPQGRVTALTNMKDGERLSLLKEVAGTQVYEARRAESLKIMLDTNNKRGKIDDLLSYIQERLEELEEEKEELKEYQEKDRERRCLEYTIYHREQEEISQTLQSINFHRGKGVDETDENREKLVEAEKVSDQIESQMGRVSQKLELHRVERMQLENERKDFVKAKAKIELEIKEYMDGQVGAQAAKLRQEAELRKVQEMIKAREAELSRIMPEFNSKREQESKIARELEEAQNARELLFAKQGRATQFRSKKQRDEFLTQEIQECLATIQARRNIHAQTVSEIGELEKNITELEGHVTEYREKLENRGGSMETAAQEAQYAKEKRDLLIDQRKELWREEARFDSVISNVQRELEKSERNLSHMMDLSTARGLASVRRIKRQYNLEGVYGTLAELFEVSDRYKTAAEVTAGSSLFHYVVDNDETATRVMEILTREQAGRVTFMPLNRLKNKPANIPQVADAVPLISKLKFDSKYQIAFEHVFGKTIVCPNLQVAAQYARTHFVNAITPEGDRSDKKGALTGGYYDPRRSRLDAIKRVSVLRDELEGQKQKLAEIRRSLTAKDQEITKAVDELQKLEQKQHQLDNSYGAMRQEVRMRTMDIQTMKEQWENKKRSIGSAETAIHSLEEQKKAYEAELTTEFKSGLNDEERGRLESLGAQIHHLRNQFVQASQLGAELAGRKRQIEVELQENLRLRLDQLQSQDAEGGQTTDGVGSFESRLQAKRKELERVNKQLTATSKRINQQEEIIRTADDEMKKMEAIKGQKHEEIEMIRKSIEKQQKKMEKSMARKAFLTEKSIECSKKIRDLGVVPEEAFDKYTKIELDVAVKRLHRVNEALKKYSHVNKKAFEQYTNFTKQKETLTKRRGELNSSQSSIEELINVLDQRKDEAIERTFKQVSREFAKIFERLVPAGRGRLVIQRRKIDDKAVRNLEGDVEEDGENQDEEDQVRLNREVRHGEQSDGNEVVAAMTGEKKSAPKVKKEGMKIQNRDSVENYTGVGISVSFNSKHDEQQRIQQLSGGQKSLCALALVFAIQRCDPAPFYLFDEIDANLDAQYRTAVATMLQELSQGDSDDNDDNSNDNSSRGGSNGNDDNSTSDAKSGGQFICTTFRPEMVQVAEKCYGVSYTNKTSSIDVVDRQSALDFVEGQRQ